MANIDKIDMLALRKALNDVDACEPGTGAEMLAQNLLRTRYREWLPDLLDLAERAKQFIEAHQHISLEAMYAEHEHRGMYLKLAEACDKVKL